MKHLLFFAVIFAAAFTSSVLSGTVSYWQQDGGDWRVLLIEEAEGIRGLLKDAKAEEWWVFSHGVKDQGEMLKAPVKSVNVTVFSPWWLRPYGGVDEVQREDVVHFALSERRDRLRVFFGGKNLIFRCVARQVQKEGEEVIPNIWKGKGEAFTSEEETLPLKMRWGQLTFISDHFAPLSSLVAREIEVIRSDFLEWAPLRLEDVSAWYFEQTIVPVLFEYSPKSVTVLIFEIRRSSASSSAVEVRSASFANENGEWKPVDLTPENLEKLHPERILYGDDDPFDLELFNPDLAPSAWLPGNIGIWSVGYQGPTAMGLVFGQFRKREENRVQVLRRLTGSRVKLHGRRR